MKRMLPVLLFSLFLLVAACTPEPVAIVNGVKISRADYDMEYKYELSNYSQQGYQLEDDEKETLKEQVLDRLVNNQLLLQAAEKAGITRDTVDVQGTLDEIIQRYDDKDAFEADIKDSGFNIEEFKGLIADILIIEDLFEAKLNLSSLVIAEEEIETAAAEFLSSMGDEAAELDPDEVLEYIAYSLKEIKAGELKMEYIEKLREESDIEYFDL